MPEFNKNLKELIVGDFGTEEMSSTGMLGNFVIGFIPVVGQIADARDTAAGFRNVWRDPDSGKAYASLGIALLGWIPGGDLLKSLKIGKKKITKKSLSAFKTGIKKAVGDGNWKVYFRISNKTKLLYRGCSNSSGVKYGFKNLVSDERTHNAIRKQYKRIDGDRLENIDLHHLWLENHRKVESEWLRKFKNSGLNYLELPSGFNRWMGGKDIREETFRSVVVNVLKGSFLLGGVVGYKIGEKISGASSNSKRHNRKKLNTD